MNNIVNSVWNYIYENREAVHLIGSLSVIIGIIYVWVIWTLRPRLKIFFSKNKTFDVARDAYRGIEEVKWIHVVVKNRGLRRAEECNGYILKIEKKISGKYQLLEGFKSDVYIYQHWANEPKEKGYDPQVIEGYRERRLDFCYLDKDGTWLRLFTESIYCGVPIAFEEGEYKFLFAVSSKNSSTVKKWFVLKWDGTWKGIEIAQSKIRNLVPTFYEMFCFLKRCLKKTTETLLVGRLKKE